MAAAAGVSTGTLAQAEIVRREAPELWDKAKAGETTIGGAYKQLRPPHVANNSGDNEWYTPQPIVDAARSLLGTIDLDPASSAEANEVVQAATIYTAEADGLALPWAGRVWMNPPYASELISRFIEKLAASVESGSVTDALVLVNNATETRWFARLMSVSSMLCLPTGRIKFWHPRKEATPLQGQAIAYSGTDYDAFARLFGVHGVVLKVVR